MPKHVWFICFLFIFFFSIRSETGASSGQNAESTTSVYYIGIHGGMDSEMGAMVNICMSMALSDFYAEHRNYKTRLSLLGGVGAAASAVRSSAKASIATLEMFECNQVVQVLFVYEHMEFSDAIIPRLTYALDNKGIQLAHKTAIPTSAKSFQIRQVLTTLRLQSKVFVVVHMSANLTSHFFAVANEAGMMSQGFTWLVTLVDTMDPIAIGSVKGVIGLRPYVRTSKALKNFVMRYNRQSRMMQNKEVTELNLSGLWVYDIVRRLATTVERWDGRNWLMGMLNTSYRGISRDFELVNVQGISNITKQGQRTTCYWTHDQGISKSKLRFRVPSKTGFKEFVNIQPGDKKSKGDEPGFTIEVFEEVWESLGLSTYDGTYDELCRKVKAKDIDAAVGNMSIVASRSNYVDFTLPYMKSGVAMLIEVGHDSSKDVNIQHEVFEEAWESLGLSHNGFEYAFVPFDETYDELCRQVKTTGISKCKMRIGVPSKTGFKEFVNIQPGDTKGNGDEPGFTIEVFKHVWDSLGLSHNGFEYEFVPFDGTYDELCCEVKAQKFDAAVGDISIVASRSNCVDFTLPYLESRVAMLIKVGHDGSEDMWIFLKPFSWDLWLAIIGIGIFIGIIVRILERPENTEFSGSPRNQLRKILIFPCLSVAIPQRDMAATNCSRLVLVVWIFLAFILMQSYTTNLSSILTVNQLQATIPSVRELRNCHVGYQNLSFVKNFLINQLGFNESMLKPYGSADDFQEALSKGPHNGGVSVIFDEIPYIRLFLAQYPIGYMIVGPTYRTDGLGFALPIGSPLVANFSRAILNFTQGKHMAPIEKKYGVLPIDLGDTGMVSSATPSLTSRSFAGLFIIIVIIVFLALLSSENHVLGRHIRRLIFRKVCDNSGSRVELTVEMTVAAVTNPPEINNVEENHNCIQDNRDESADEATLEADSPS